ncbi:hypothetical protein [uncultured Microscilla sp.]|uniref:hypothetical protein n=1 Tax=uncultured Microscilla sp. TaxID=432653 RepID=UPI00260656F1|nr:hypothetical protein [uncultured Microscilla sp.]
MRNSIYTYLWLVSLLCLASPVQAQYTVFKFVAENDHKALSLHSTGLVKDSVQTSENQLVQLFILKRTGDNVLIAAASDPTLFLKRNTDGTLVLTQITGNNPEPAEFQWRILFAGIPYLVIADPSDSSKAIHYDGSSFKVGTLPQIPNNGSTVAQDFRFKIQKVTNTF